MDLLPKLRRVSDLWVEAQQRTDSSVSLKTLGVRAVSNSKLFDRAGMSVATFQAMVLWLGDPANWPAALVPAEAVEALRELGILVPAQHWLPTAAAA